MDTSRRLLGCSVPTSGQGDQPQFPKLQHGHSLLSWMDIQARILRYLLRGPSSTPAFGFRSGSFSSASELPKPSPPSPFHGNGSAPEGGPSPQSALQGWLFGLYNGFLQRGSLKDRFCQHLKHVAFSTKIKGNLHLQVAMFRCILRPDPCSTQTQNWVISPETSTAELKSSLQVAKK